MRYVITARMRNNTKLQPCEKDLVTIFKGGQCALHLDFTTHLRDLFILVIAPRGAKKVLGHKVHL